MRSYEIIRVYTQCYRRFLAMFVRRSIFVLVLVCLGCSAQIRCLPIQAQRIERQVRATYIFPAGR